MYLVWTQHLHSIDILRVQFDVSQLGVEPFLGSLEVSAYGLIVSRTKVEEV